MLKLFRSRLAWGAFAATVVMCLTAAIAPMSLAWLDEAQAQRRQTEEDVTNLRRVESLLVDAETGQRGYVITGKEGFLQPYLEAVGLLPAEMTSLQRRFAEAPPNRRAIVEKVVENSNLKLAELAETVQLRRTKGFAGVEPVITAAHGQHYMDEVRRLVDELEAVELGDLRLLDERLHARSIRAMLFSTVSTVLTMALLIAMGATVLRTLRAREQASGELRDATIRLEEGMAELRERNHEISTLGEMSRVLQTEMSLVEALEVTGLFCGQLLPDTSGAIYLFRNSADLLEHAAGWRDAAQAPPATIEPMSCWGMRRGQLHVCRTHGDLRCPHYAQQRANGTHLCLPLSAYGEVLGQLHVWTDHELTEQRAREVISMTQTISEQVALSLSNTKLRQVLRDQSIKDPLTGLFNRRYMEETLARELARAQRNGKPLALVMADLDHFKRINDTYGHPAGDAVLRGAAQHLQRAVRSSDVACRFGGEEFVLILSDCTKESAVTKAEDMCRRLRMFTANEGAHAIRVTASFGVAAFPDDAAELAQLVQAADQALYQAKQEGRNRVVVATEAMGFPPPTAPGRLTSVEHTRSRQAG